MNHIEDVTNPLNVKTYIKFINKHVYYDKLKKIR